MPKKVEKKVEPEPAAPIAEPEPKSAEEPAFALPKKKVTAPRKILPKEEPKEEESPFGKIKLKKAETVKRTWEDDGLAKEFY